MDKNQNMLINAMCLYTVPEVMRMSALFSGLSEVLEKAMTGFVQAVSGGQAALELGSFFDDEMDELVVEVIKQLHAQSDVLLEEYGEQLREIESNGALAVASQQSSYFEKLVPALKPLDQLLTAKDILAYASFMNNEDAHAKALVGFIDSFAPIFKHMEAARQAEMEQETKNIKSWFRAAEDNDVAALAMLHSDGIDIEARDDNDKTALALAVMNANLEAAGYLSSLGASPMRTFSSDSPISIAVENNSAEIVAVLLSSEHDDLNKINWDSLITNSDAELISDEYRETLLHILAFNSDDIDIKALASSAIKTQANELFLALFDYGLGANEEFHSTPLIFTAVEEGNLSALTTLIDQGADINIKNRSDESLLEVAVENGLKEMAELLIDSNIKLEFGNHYTSHNLMMNLAKLRNGSVDDCIKLGLFDPSAYDNFGRSFLHVLVSRYDEEDTSPEEVKREIDVLIDNLQVDINQTTEDGSDTAVTLANHQVVIESLFTHNPDVSKELSYNKSVMSKLVDMLDGAALAIAIKAGIDPNVRVADVPLLHYCFKSKPEHITRLIEKGADLNATDKNNLTILQKWIASKELIEPYLIEMSNRGADFSLNTKTGLPIFHALSAIYDGDLIKNIVNITGIDVHVSDAGNNNAMMQACLAKNISGLMALSELGVDVSQANNLGGTPLLHAVYDDNVELFNVLVDNCGAKINTELAGKRLIFIANQLASYDVWNILIELDK